MSKEAEFIKGLLDTKKKEVEMQEMIVRMTREEETARLEREKMLIVQKGKEILKGFGISKLFQELIDEKVVISSHDPIKEKFPVYKKDFWGNKTLERYDYKTVKDYTPAWYSEQCDEAKITLYFDEYETGGEYSRSFKKCVIARVFNGDVEIGCSTDDSYRGGEFEKVNDNLHELVANKIFQARSTPY